MPTLFIFMNIIFSSYFIFIFILNKTFRSTSKTAIPTPKPSQPPKTTPPTPRDKDLDDIDGLLQEIGSFTPPPVHHTKKVITQQSSPLSVSIPKTSKSEEITTPTQTGAKRRYYNISIVHFIF